MRGVTSVVPWGLCLSPDRMDQHTLWRTCLRRLRSESCKCVPILVELFSYEPLMSKTYSISSKIMSKTYTLKTIWSSRQNYDYSCIYYNIFYCSQILLPRLEGGQVNSTILDLGNYSTLMIDVPSPDITLVLKMEPSEDIPFVLLLGYKDYPKDKQYIAKTQMPHQGNSQGDQPPELTSCKWQRHRTIVKHNEQTTLSV